MAKLQKSDEEWKQQLTPEQYAVLRQRGTEAPFTGALLQNHETGMYACAACGAELFDSNTKFDSKSGWPSFNDAKPGAVKFNQDNSHGMVRIEVTCANCGSHLGHMFPVGSLQPTGQYFCINSVSLKFKPKKKP